MHRIIGASEARSKLPELLRGVMAGNRYTITLRGIAVAELVPAALDRRADVTLAVQQMRQFIREHRPVQVADIKSLISCGRP